MGDLADKVMGKAAEKPEKPKPPERKPRIPVFVPRMGPDYDDDDDLEKKRKDLPPVYKSHWR